MEGLHASACGRKISGKKRAKLYINQDGIGSFDPESHKYFVVSKISFPMSTQYDPSSILQTAFGFFNSKVLHTAVELGVFTQLARGPHEAAIAYQ
jgi:hypothetical protein